jgi:hypothetical protein
MCLEEGGTSRTEQSAGGSAGKEVLLIKRRWEMSDVAKKKSVCAALKIYFESKTWFWRRGTGVNDLEALAGGLS